MDTVFVDFEGVLITASSYTRALREAQDSSDRASHFDPTCIARLNRLCAQQDLKVVLSTDWRYHNSFEDLAAALSRAGLQADVVGALAKDPEGARHEHRGEAIAAWVKAHSVQRHVILDSRIERLPGQPWVMVDPDLGLSESDLRRAEDFLPPLVLEAAPELQAA